MTENDDTLEDAQASQVSALVPFRQYLFIVLECDRPGAGGARHALVGIDEIVVGRGRERAVTRETVGGVHRLVVRVPGRSMSSTHARFHRVGAGWELEDARSTNGSFVNGVRTERVQLRERDIVELGHTIFALRHTVPTPPGTPQAFDSAENPPKAPGLATLMPLLFEEFEKLVQMAGSNVSLLLLGETGTGKEVIAQAVHRLSGRCGAFVAVNCGALPSNLLESSLFGHVKGAFSGAATDSLGFFRTAQGGTLLLDEIGDLPLDAQAALLRVVQEKEVTPVGSTRPIRVDVRVIAATHRPLDTLVQSGRFRGDLLARLDGYRCRLPSLRSRREDLGILAGDALRSAATGVELKLAPEAGLELVSYDWPFNVRELVQTLSRSAVFAEQGLITKANLRLDAKPSSRESDPDDPPDDRPLGPEDLALKEALFQNLQSTGGNVSEVARAMGKARMQIQRWMKRYGIDPKTFRP